MHDNDNCYPDELGNGCTTGISAGVAFLIWLIILIILIWILRALCIHWFSTIVFSFVVSTIILAFIFPLNITNGKYIGKQEDGLFGLIVLITWVLLVIYIIWKVFTDRDRSCMERRGSWWGDDCKMKPTGQMMPKTMSDLAPSEVPVNVGGVQGMATGPGGRSVPITVGGVPGTVKPI